MIRLPLSIAEDHPAFAGHFPSRPIVPGVVLLDHGLRALAIHRDAAVDARPARIAAAKFLSFVGPGEPVRLEIEPSTTTPDAYRLRIYAGDAEHERLALSGQVSYAQDDR